MRTRRGDSRESKPETLQCVKKDSPVGPGGLRIALGNERLVRRRGVSANVRRAPGHSLSFVWEFGSLIIGSKVLIVVKKSIPRKIKKESCICFDVAFCSRLAVYQFLLSASHTCRTAGKKYRNSKIRKFENCTQLRFKTGRSKTSHFSKKLLGPRKVTRRNGYIGFEAGVCCGSWVSPGRRLRR